MKSHAMHHFLKTVAAGLAVATALLSAAVEAADAVPVGVAQSPGTSTNTSRATWNSVSTKTITTDGVTFAYRELGKQNGGTPVVLLVHLAAVLDNWDPRVVDGLAAKHHVVTFDNRGHGMSEKPPGPER